MKRLCFAAIALALACLPASAEMIVSEGEFATLQAVMQSHIDQNLVDGALLHLDEKTGKVRSLYPAKAHPIVMLVGGYYFLCADFRDENGKKVMINFYAAKDRDRYVVFYTDFNENAALGHLVEKNGKLASN